jgi:serine/threonine protein kinase/TolB-like protein
LLGAVVMTPERWQRIDTLFHAALDREPAERFAFLSQACSGDESLRIEVESLISAHEQSGDFIGTPASDVATELLAGGYAGLMPGQMVGHYRIVSLLGAGGMGEVYLADDTRLRRNVALKLLPTHFTINRDRLRRFEREARAASALNHPNIITIHEIGQTDAAHFIVTEFIDGITLRQRVAGPGISLHEAMDVAIQVANALEAAHKAGIVHRDIKPENIMLRPDGLVKVLDFGLAKLSEEHSSRTGDASTPGSARTSSGLVMGTVNYMSPEQARGLPIDARSDIFSLGIVLYEMITGRAPFDGPTTSDIIVAILEKEPPPLSHYAADVPTDLEWILKKSLGKGREERYQTIKDLLLDLKKLKQELDLGSMVGAAQSGSKDGAPATKWAIRRSVEGDGKRSSQIGEVKSTRTASAVKNIRPSRGARVALAAVALLLVGATIIFLIKSNTNRDRAQPVLDAGMTRIAVLPFKQLSAESRDEARELGMSDTLINKLSGIKQLVVWPLSDVRKYRGLDQNPVAAGRELRVDYVLEGNIQMSGGETRVTWRLLNVKDGSAVWADKCDEQCSNEFELQDTIAEQIAGRWR